jgi:recombinational DNA repair ATPase RecF
MLETLSIKNFRNFRSLQIESLARVNLIVGRNNAGTTNLLDAISIYAAAADLNWIAQILRRRELLQKNYEKWVYRLCATCGLIATNSYVQGCISNEQGVSRHCP